MSERERLSGLWDKRTMTLEQLDQWVREFGEGCDDGQYRFVQFVEHCMARTGDEIVALNDHRRAVKYLRQYEQLTNLAVSRERSFYRYERHPFQPMGEGFDEFCHYCSCRKPVHDESLGVVEPEIEYEPDEEDY